MGAAWRPGRQVHTAAFIDDSCLRWSRRIEGIRRVAASLWYSLIKPMNERGKSRDRLSIALGITIAWFIIELVGGLLTNSLALLADAAHMLADIAAIGLSLFALAISSRPATHAKTYGYLRAEILAALANGVFLVLIGMYISYEAYQRFLSPPLVRGVPMLIVAATGLIANIATAGLLYRTQHDNLNVRGVFLHVMGDTLGSLGAIIAGLIMILWHWYPADPIV